MIEKYKHINVNPWQFSKEYPKEGYFDIKLVCGSILCECWCSAGFVVWVSPSERNQVDVYFSFEDKTILGWRLSVCKQ